MKHKTIWKYQFETEDEQSFLMPSGAEILCVQLQNGFPCLWVLVDPEAIKVNVIIEIFGTGHPIQEGERQYLGTVQTGPLVWHVFERKP